jgi:hypothetical protein
VAPGSGSKASGPRPGKASGGTKAAADETPDHAQTDSPAETPAQADGVRRTAADAESLPFTGAPLLPAVAAAALLVLAGAGLRRTVRS